MTANDSTPTTNAATNPPPQGPGTSGVAGATLVNGKTKSDFVRGRIVHQRKSNAKNIIAVAGATVAAALSVFGTHTSQPALNVPTVLSVPGLDASTGAFNGCGMQGNPANPLNLLKNRYNLPALSDIDNTVDIGKMLQSKAPDASGVYPATGLNQNKAASIIGYILLIKPGGKESCNCEQANDLAFMDTHIYVARQPTTDKRQAVIVEVTPRLRAIKKLQGEDWATPTLMNTYKPGTKVQVSGWLFYDKEHEDAAENLHPGAPHNWRGTCWEIHPVTSIDAIPSEEPGG